jgi:hypothetical protein
MSSFGRSIGTSKSAVRRITPVFRAALMVAMALMAAIPAATVFQPRTAHAAWSASFESGKATFEIVPANRAVNASIDCQIVNQDPTTIGGLRYYDGWSMMVPVEASKIKVADQGGPLNFTTSSGEYWTTVRISLRSDLFYGGRAAFTVSYDLALPNANQADFYAWTPRGSFQTTIIVPKSYYEDFTLEPKEQSRTDLGTKTAYKYTFSGVDYQPIAVEGARKGLTVTRSGSVKLARKSVPIIVSLWEGEDQEAQRILDLYVSALPVLEQITGVSFPPDYAVKVAEGTTTELKGYAGQNDGQNGIKVLWSSKTDSTLLHELAHYWADRPPWGETWMREGQASLYASMALENLGKTQTAAAYRNYRTGEYEDGKIQYDKPLYDWKTPSSYTGQGEVGFGYGKSFVFMSDLQTVIGPDGMQKTNQTVFGGGTTVTWLDYMDALESATGKQMRSAFFDWIIPRTFEPALARYADVKSAVSQPKDRFGINSVEKRLSNARSQLVSGDVGTATSSFDNTMSTLQDWQRALKACRTAENISSGLTDLLGSGPFDDALTSAKDYLRNGSYSQSEVKGLEAKDVFGQWQGALTAYREAESTIASESKAMSAEFTSEALGTAKGTLMRGDYSGALSQSKSALALVPVWKDAVTAVRAAESDLMKARSEGRTWQLKKAEESIAQARQLVADGEFAASVPVSHITSDIARRGVTPFRALLPFGLGGLAALAAAFGAVFWVRRRKAQAAT